MDMNKAGAPSRPLEEQAMRVAKLRGHIKGTRFNGRRDWTGEQAAIYCRISHINDEDQTGVDRQQRICQEVADRLGLIVPPHLIFVDNNRSAWQRKRKRPGWDKLLDAARAGHARHILCYHPDRLMRQPHDLETLLIISDENEITLHGQANQRELSDPDDRFFLRIEVAHACRSSDDTSRRAVDKQLDLASEGRPHTGKRRFGYSPDGKTIIEDEARWINMVFRSYLTGDTPGEIRVALKDAGVKTALGKEWTDQGVRQLLDNPYVAGLRVYKDEVLGRGTWPAIISEPIFAEAKAKRAKRSRSYKTAQTTHVKRFYALRGVVTCARCAVRMSGSKGNGPVYICARHQRSDELQCKRTIGAQTLEAFVIDGMLGFLEKLSPTGRVSQATTTPANAAAIKDAQADIAVAYDMWRKNEHSLAAYREIKLQAESRIAAHQPKMIDRPTAEVLGSVIGPNARPGWKKLEEAQDYARMNSIICYVIAEVRIDENTTGRGVFDYSRIEVKRNPM